MAEHKVICTDETVRGSRGTVARCLCGWNSSWGVRDGSAEADAHSHMMGSDDAYRQAHIARVEAHNAMVRESGCTCDLFAESYVRVLDINCPVHGMRPSPTVSAAISEACHLCSCHINPPCGACENCKHWDVDDCPNDCQLCEYDHWRTGPYRLADGTWSDGVDRSQPLVMSGFGSANEDRMTVFWMRHGSKFGVAAGNPETFPEFNSFAEAIAYADNLARTTKNGENK